MSKQLFAITSAGWTTVGDGHTDVSFEGYELIFADSHDAMPSNALGETFIIQPTGANASVTLRFDAAVWARVRMSTDQVVSLLSRPSTAAEPYEQPSPDVRVTPGIQYGTSQSVGVLLAITGVMGTKPIVEVVSALLRCKSVQTAGFKLYLFGKPPTTEYVDRGPIALDPVDAPLLAGVISLTNPDSGLGASLYQTEGLHLGGVANNTIYALLAPTAPVTFHSADDLSLDLGIAC